MITASYNIASFGKHFDNLILYTEWQTKFGCGRKQRF